jgi:hypothetical protein
MFARAIQSRVDRGAYSWIMPSTRSRRTILPSADTVRTPEPLGRGRALGAGGRRARRKRARPARGAAARRRAGEDDRLLTSGRVLGDELGLAAHRCRDRPRPGTGRLPRGDTGCGWLPPRCMNANRRPRAVTGRLPLRAVAGAEHPTNRGDPEEGDQRCRWTFTRGANRRVVVCPSRTGPAPAASRATRPASGPWRRPSRAPSRGHRSIPRAPRIVLPGIAARVGGNPDARSAPRRST